MARRRQMRIDPSVFLQQQGGGDEASQLAMAMEMLGFGKGEQLGRGRLGLEREQLAADIGLKGRGQDIEERKLAAEIKKAEAQEEFNNWVKAKTLEGQEEERKYKADELLSKAQQSRDVLNARILEFETDADKRRALIGAMSPEAQAGYTKLEAVQQNKLAGDVLKNVQAAYKTGNKGQIETALTGVPQEILQRPEFEWQKWNQGMPGPQPGFWERLRNLGGSEKERAVAEAAKVAPPPSGPAPSTVSPTTRPMVFTGYEAPVEGPVRRGYGAAPGGDVGPALPELLAKILGPAAPPSSGRGYYTPQTPVEVPPAFDYMAGGPSAMPPKIQPQVSVNDLLSRLMVPGTSVMAPY